MSIDVQICDDQQDLPISENSVKQVVEEFIKVANIYYDEVTIHFVDTATISTLHLDYFNDPSTTDCISFPMDEPEELDTYKVMGDVFICPETAINYAKENRKDPYQEATLYLIHGLLHLIGYDDIEESDRQLMREAETLHLKQIEEKKIWLRSKK